MEKKSETRERIVKVAIWVVVILALMGTAHILVNYFDVVTVLKAIHGG
jgi:hypothetical protein